MKSLVIIPSIRNSSCFNEYANNFLEYNHRPTIMVIDENGKWRKEIRKQIPDDLEVLFFGTKERNKWFKERNLKNDVIPKRAHNENSFGLLWALNKNFDMIVFLDDDTYPIEGDFLESHYDVLYNKQIPMVTSNEKFISPFENIYVRGFPSSLRRIGFKVKKTNIMINNPVLNLGLWQGVPDLNALDFLFYGYMNAYTTMKLPSIQSRILDNKLYIPICSMNLAFKPEIIPAFYQLWFNDRHDDIFSGLFLLRILRHLKKYIAYGQPYCYHDKSPRNVYPQVKAELPSMEITDNLWKILDEIEIKDDTYIECYKSLISGLRKKTNSEYFSILIQKMENWTKIVEILIK